MYIFWGGSVVSQFLRYIISNHSTRLNACNTITFPKWTNRSGRKHTRRAVVAKSHEIKVHDHINYFLSRRGLTQPGLASFLMSPKYLPILPFISSTSYHCILNRTAERTVYIILNLSWFFFPYSPRSVFVKAVLTALCFQTTKKKVLYIYLNLLSSTFYCPNCTVFWFVFMSWDK